MSITEENPLKPRFPLHCNFLDCLSFTLYILLFSSFSSLPKLQKSKNLSKLLQSKLRDYLTNNGRKVDSVQDEIASDSLSDENPRQVFKNCVGSKVHSADQMIIWMTQHRALKLHIERVEIHKKSYEADGTFGSPDHSLSQLQKVMDTTTDNGTRGLNIYMWQGVGVNAHVDNELPQFVADIVGKTFTFQLML